MTLNVTAAVRAAWREMGNGDVFAVLCAMAPDLDLFSMSVDWRHGDYALKCKGARGDLLILFGN